MSSTEQAQTAPKCLTLLNQRVCYQLIDGYAITEGDVNLGREADLLSMLVPRGGLLKGASGMPGLGEPGDEEGASVGVRSFVITSLPNRWANRTVPYEIDGSIADTSAGIEKAMQHVREKAGFTFVRRTNQPDYVRFVRSTTQGACWSYIGRIGGEQDLQVAPGQNPGCIVHELGHAIGMHHEQKRGDRDNHVTIHFENVKDGFAPQFDKQSDGNMSRPYDIESVMHYPATAFSKNGRPTITRKDGSTAGLGYKSYFSGGDVAGLAELYGAVSAPDANEYAPIDYVLLNQDLAKGFGYDPPALARHWNDFGKKEGRTALVSFGVRDYLARNPDVAKVFGQDFVAAENHWVKNGIREGRVGSAAFDARYYLAKYPDLVKAFGANNYAAAHRHFLDNGIREGRRGSAEFDLAYYFKTYPAVSDASGDGPYRNLIGTLHYVGYGKPAGLVGAAPEGT